MDNYRRADATLPPMLAGFNNWGSKPFNNVLTISIKSILKRYIMRESITENPQYECKITFKYIQSFISDQQFQALLSITNKIS